MKLITTDKLTHCYETFKGTAGSWMVFATLSKDTAQWNWNCRIWFTDADGMNWEQGYFVGHQYSKPESREEMEGCISEQIDKAPWLG